MTKSIIFNKQMMRHFETFLQYLFMVGIQILTSNHSYLYLNYFWGFKPKVQIAITSQRKESSLSYICGITTIKIRERTNFIYRSCHVCLYQVNIGTFDLL